MTPTTASDSNQPLGRCATAAPSSQPAASGCRLQLESEVWTETMPLPFTQLRPVSSPRTIDGDDFAVYGWEEIGRVEMASCRNFVSLFAAVSGSTESSQSQSHTPSLAFRHLPPRRKDVVNQCLEFVSVSPHPVLAAAAAAATKCLVSTPQNSNSLSNNPRGLTCV